MLLLDLAEVMRRSGWGAVDGEFCDELAELRYCVEFDGG
jgi:hypothetical protein